MRMLNLSGVAEDQKPGSVLRAKEICKVTEKYTGDFRTKEAVGIADIFIEAENCSREQAKHSVVCGK